MIFTVDSFPAESHHCWLESGVALLGVTLCVMTNGGRCFLANEMFAELNEAADPSS